jgi:integrase
LWALTSADEVRSESRKGQAESTSPTAPLAQLERKDELDVRTQDLLDNARAPRTRAAYERDWRAFERWCKALEFVSLPASPLTLARYLTYLAEGGRKLSTIRRARIAIGVMHASRSAARPDQDARIRTLERGIAKTYGARERSARPLLLEELERAIGVLGAGACADRDRALLLLGFWGAFRAGELAALRIEHLTVSDSALRVFLERSKADPCRRGVYVDVGRGHANSLCAVTAVRAWLNRLRQGTGPAFRTVLGERVLDQPMSARAISRVVARVARCAALERPDEFSAHSLRAGLATSAYVRGVSEREIQAHGRWRDRRSLDRYIQLGAVPDRPNLVSAFV